MHIIRLRHPWTCELSGTLAVWSRRFNWPAGLTPREVVWLVIEPWHAETRVEVNDQVLEVAAAPGRFDITGLLTEYNRLTITVSDATGAQENRCPLDVRLEVDEG